MTNLKDRFYKNFRCLDVEKCKLSCGRPDSHVAKNILNFISDEIKQAKKEILEELLDKGHGGGNFRRLINQMKNGR